MGLKVVRVRVRVRVMFMCVVVNVLFVVFVNGDEILVLVGI